MNILVTDAWMKHGQAVLRSIKKSFPAFHLTAHKQWNSLLNKPSGRFADELVEDRSLEELLDRRSFDLIVPVGGASVKTVVAVCPEKAVLPRREAVELAFDKARILDLAASLGIPVPRSEITHANELAKLSSEHLPFVLKSADETAGKFVFYCSTIGDIEKTATALIRIGFGEKPLLAQQRLVGRGFGVSMLFNRGRCVMSFAHERIREFPASGGVSSAARSIRNDLLDDYARRIGAALDWHGVLMCEFKYDNHLGKYFFLEANPKMWGSIDLPIACGVDFPAALVAQFLGQPVMQPHYEAGIEFVWPLDGDIETILRLREFSAVFQYFSRRCHNNIGYTPYNDVLLFLRLLYRIVSLKYLTDTR